MFLIDRLNELNYDFDKLPSQVKIAIDTLTELRLASNDNANQKLEVLDMEIFRTIEVMDSDEIVEQVRAELNFDRKLDSNNSFNEEVIIPTLPQYQAISGLTEYDENLKTKKVESS